MKTRLRANLFLLLPVTCFLLLNFICFLLVPPACLAVDDLFDIKPVADGIYAAIAKPAYKVNCNAVIILLDDGVLVVDTHSKPSAARALIEQIKKLTPKPVKYVVNTHFHWDHYQGNEAYPSSWPAGVEIISSEATRANIQRLGIPRIKNEIVSMPQEIARLKSDLEKASNAEQKTAIQENLRQAEAYFAELKLIEVTLPTMTFDHSLILHGKEKFELWKQYFQDLMERTAAVYAEGASLDEAKKSVSDFLVKKYAAKFDPGFPNSVIGNVAKAYQVIAFPR